MARVEWDSDATPFEVGDRVRTGMRLTLPEGFEAMHDLLADELGEVVSVDVHTIKALVERGADGSAPAASEVKLSTCTVRLDKFPDNPLVFHPSELGREAAA